MPDDVIKYYVSGIPSGTNYGLVKENVPSAVGTFPLRQATPVRTLFKNYCTLYWANKFFSEYVYDEVWNDASEQKKQSALNAATDFIDSYVKFFDNDGNEITYEHLEFDNDYDNAKNPFILKEACALEASYLLSLDDNPAEPLPITILGLLKGDFGQVDKELVPPIFTNQVIHLLTQLGGVIDEQALIDRKVGCYVKRKT
jgi:hypothetical protein